MNILKMDPNLFSLSYKISSWEEVFKILFTSGEPSVLILDEFPFIVDINPSLPSVLQNLWDQHKNSTKLNIILCGSLVSTMLDLMGAK